MKYECQGTGIGAACGAEATCIVKSFGVDKQGNIENRNVWFCIKHYSELNRVRGAQHEDRLFGKF